MFSKVIFGKEWCMAFTSFVPHRTDIYSKNVTILMSYAVTAKTMSGP